MPYRRSGTKVQVKKGGKWHTLKDYAGQKNAVEKAEKYRKALEVNVHHKG